LTEGHVPVFRPARESTTNPEVRVPLTPRDRLIVALDLPSLSDADAMVETLGDAVSFYKVGYQLAFAGGLTFVDRLIKSGKQVFLDMKLHDIGNTVGKGVESVAKTGVTFLTVHAFPQTMRAAVEARQGSKLKILAVTVLTSYDDIDLVEAGYTSDVDTLVARRAQQASDIGIDGLVCSPEEASPLRLAVGNGMLFVTPGVRPVGAAHGDQKRVATPSQAIAAGADYLVVGRPITGAKDPKACAQAIVDEIAQAAKSA
jgi:orotidine-5'-phosphate decarboxylase